MNCRKIYTTLSLFFFFLFQINAQTVSLIGYTYETNDRGFLNEVKITVLKLPNQSIIAETVSNLDGEFKCELPTGANFLVRAEKDIFETFEIETSTVGKSSGEKLFLKMEMKRKPGYLFEATLAEKRTKKDETVDAIQNSRIEVYNNTTEKEELVLENHPDPYFSFTFEQGNHYTIMIRKEGFLTKRIEAYINVKGCIICVDGVKKLGPGVTDNLTHGFEMGTLLANIELDRADLDSKIAIDNIYYDLNKWAIRPEAAKELDKVVTLMNDNPEIIVELGSHTDARGGDKFNLELSEKRAASAVKYIVETGKINSNRIKSKGYGETVLINDCRNGVKCSEKKHQLNRRTELKIIGFKEKQAFKTLEMIIREEKFAKQLEMIDNQESIRINKEGKAVKEDVPVKVETGNQKKSMTSSDDIIIDMAIDSLRGYLKERENKNVSSSNKSNVEASSHSISAPANRSDYHISEPVEKRDDIKLAAEKELSDMKNSNASDNDSFRNKPSSIKTEAIGGKGTLITTEDIKSGSNKNSDDDDSIHKNIQQVSDGVSTDYSGYKVEAIRAKNHLPYDHEIFKHYGTVTVERLPNGELAYLLGDFKSRPIALYYLNNTIYPKFNQARLIKFREGEREYK